MIERQIKRGQKFMGMSKGKPAVWEVTRRVKTEKENKIWCKVVDGSVQEKAYTGKQFGYLLRSCLITLI